MEGTSSPAGSSLEIPPRTLGERVFDLLPETVSGRLSSSYDRGKIARRVLQELGTKERDEKALCNGIISAIYLDEDIPRSIKMNLLKHMENVVSVHKNAQNDTLNYFKKVNESMGQKIAEGSLPPDQAVSGDVLSDSVNELVVSGSDLNVSKQKTPLANTHTKIDDEIDRQTFATGADAGPGYGEKDEQRKLIKRSKASKNSRTTISPSSVTDSDGMLMNEKRDAEEKEGKVSVEVPTLEKSTDEIRDTSRENITDHNRETNDALKNSFGREEEEIISDTSRKSIEEHSRETDEAMKPAFGNTEALPDDQKVNPPSEGYFGSPDYKEAIDDQAEIQPEKKRGMDADGIVEGFGVIGEKAPEIVLEEDREQTEPKGDSRETLLELKSRVEALKKVADEKRSEYLRLKRRNEAKWYDVRKYFFRTKQEKQTLPQNLIKEIQYKETEWKHSLTEYSETHLLLAKRESLEARDGQKRTTGEVMAGALNEMKFRNSIENYNAWKDASWGDRDDSWFTRALGRTEKWAEEYRKLDWKKRVAISAVVTGVSVSGAVLGSVGLAGLGAGGMLVLRILGSYGVGRGVYEFSEARANKKTLEYNEKALSAFKSGEGLDFEALEFQIKNYADRTVRDLDRAVKENQRRIRMGALSGVALFTVGNVFAYRDAIQDFAGQVSSEATKFFEQMKIITGLEDLSAVPVSIAGAPIDQSVEVASAANTGAVEGVTNSAHAAGAAVKGVAEIPASSANTTEDMLRAAKQLTNDGQVRGVPLSGAGAVEAVPPVSGAGELASETAGKIVEDKANEIGQVLVAGRDGNSFERMFQNAGYDGAASHRAVLRFMEETGITQEKMDKIFNGAKAIIVPDDTDPKTPFRIIGITRESGGAIISTTKVPGAENLIQRITDTSELSNSVSQGGIPSGAPVIESSSPELVQKVISPSPEPITSPALNNGLTRGLNIPEVFSSQPTSIGPSDIFERGAPEDVLAKALPSELPIVRESQDFLQENVYTPLTRYRELLPYFHGVFDHILISNPEKIALQNIFLAGESLNGRPPSEGLISDTQDTLFQIFFPGKDSGALFNESTRVIPKLFRSNSPEMEHFEAVYGALKKGYVEGSKLKVSNNTIYGWLYDVADYILKNPMHLEKIK